MEELLQFLKKYEGFIYILAGIVAFIYLLRMTKAWQEWRNAVFGLERENAQRRFSSAMTVLILIALFTMTAFILVSFVSPTLPQTAMLSTPTLDVLATSTATIEPGDGTVFATPTIGVISMATPSSGDCLPGRIEWIDPTEDSQIGGTVTLMGTVDVENFGFYKYEFSQPPGETWSTIAAGDQMGKNKEIGKWNTTQMTPGDYLLRLVVVDNKNQPFPACVIQVRVIPPTPVP
jgi:hypothetical protein